MNPYKSHERNKKRNLWQRNMMAKMDDLIWNHIQNNLTAKLPGNLTNKIINTLPELPDIIRLSHNGLLSGKHFPCLHEVTTQITDAMPIKKSRDGKTVAFVCKTIRDAKNAVKNINSDLYDYGYDAYNDDNFVTVRTSDYTSVSTMLGTMGLVGLYCIHLKNEEKFYFGVPYDLKIFDIHKEIKKRKNLAKKKFGITLKIPDKLILKRCDMYIPDSDAVDPKFLEFIIKNKPTRQQLKTYMCLYQLVQINIPIQHLDKWDLVEIVHKHTGNPIKTLRNQLVDNKNPLQKRIMEIFEYEIPNLTITPQFRMPPESFLDRLDYTLRSMQEPSTTKIDSETK